jgi:hypothetical protein
VSRRHPVRRRPPAARWVRMVARAWYWMQSLLAAPLRLASEYISIALAPNGVIHGISVYVLDTQRARREEVCARLDRALTLIQRLDHRRYSRLRRDVRRILVVPRPSDHLMPGTVTCYLSETRVLGRPDVPVALTLVHEATHARLQRAGLQYWPDLQERMEHLCITEQIRVTQLLPRVGYRVPPETEREWQDLLRTYPATKGGRFYRWLIRERAAG